MYKKCCCKPLFLVIIIVKVEVEVGVALFFLVGPMISILVVVLRVKLCSSWTLGVKNMLFWQVERLEVPFNECVSPLNLDLFKGIFYFLHINQ